MSPAPLIFADRDDLPAGMVMEAFEGQLRVLDGEGHPRGTCAQRGGRWTWTVGSLSGIAPNVEIAWLSVTERLC